MVVAATGEVKELMRGGKQALFQPEVAEDLSRAILSQLEAPFIPALEAPSWDQRGLLLSSYIEKMVPE
jgi:hypothetical protein